MTYAQLRPHLHEPDLIGMSARDAHCIARGATVDDTDAERHRPVSDADADTATTQRRRRQNEPTMPPAETGETTQTQPPQDDGFDFAAVDIVDIEDLAIAFCRTNRHIPAAKGMRKDAENRILRAHGIPLATIVSQYEQEGHEYVPEDDKTLERALKWHIIQHEALLRMSNDRGGHTARRRQVGAQLHLWETGGQRALIEQLLVDRRDAKRERDLLQRAEEQVRPQIAGGRADTARMQDMAALNRLRDAMMMLGKNKGVLDTNNPDIQKQRGPHRQRGL